jgi:hypothetical protein
MGFLSTYWTDFIGRFDGPLHFRLFVQKLMAILFAVRDGSRDAREGRSAYLWALLTDPTQRRYLPLQALVESTHWHSVLAPPARPGQFLPVAASISPPFS